MVLLLLQEKNALNPNQISIEFDDSLDNFHDFEQLFKAFRELDSICAKFLNSKHDEAKIKIDVHSEVKRLSKNSPFELSAFITEHWFEILLFVWSSYDRIRPNAELIFKDLFDLTDSIETTLRDVTAEFPKLEIEKLDEVLTWFNNLPFMEKATIAKMMIKQSKIFRKITKVKFGKK